MLNIKRIKKFTFLYILFFIFIFKLNFKNLLKLIINNYFYITAICLNKLVTIFLYLDIYYVKSVNLLLIILNYNINSFKFAKFVRLF